MLVACAEVNSRSYVAGLAAVASGEQAFVRAYQGSLTPVVRVISPEKSSVWPNPVANGGHVRISGGVEGSRYAITDPSGKSHGLVRIVSGAIALPALDAGLYFLRATEGLEQPTVTVVVQ